MNSPPHAPPLDDSAPSEQLAALVQRQRTFFEAGSTRPLAFRRDALQSLMAGLRDREERFLTALHEDLGKPAIEAFVAEIHFLQEEIRLARRGLRRWLRPRRARAPFYHWPARCEVRREPFGSALVFAPWNYPLQLALAPVISAIAGGNTVVLKPSELTPATSRELFSLMADLFAPEHVAVVQGEAAVGEALLAQPFDFVFFTGSGRVGRKVAAACAARPTPHVLELGGKCPALVDETVDIEMTASRLATGKFFNAGQTCFAPDFVLVAEAVREPLTQALRAELESRYGNQVEEDLAGLPHRAHAERLLKALDPVPAGSLIQIGEDRLDQHPPRLAPRLVNGPPWDHPLMQDEIFGPVLPLVGYQSSEEALARLRSLPAPLALYLFTRDREWQQAVAEAIPSGSLAFNDCLKQAQNLHLPFGGVGASGHGRYRGKDGFETFTYARAVTRRYFVRDPFELVPPFAGKLEQLRKVLR